MVSVLLEADNNNNKSKIDDKYVSIMTKLNTVLYSMAGKWLNKFIEGRESENNGCR